MFRTDKQRKNLKTPITVKGGDFFSPVLTSVSSVESLLDLLDYSMNIDQMNSYYV